MMDETQGMKLGLKKDTLRRLARVGKMNSQDDERLERSKQMGEDK